MDNAAFNSPDVLKKLSDSFLERYNQSGPRYTSYPTAPMWRESFDSSAFKVALIEVNADVNVELNSTVSTLRPLSLYTHLPFCESRCLFCGCNVVISRSNDAVETYLDYLFKEIDRVAELTSSKRHVSQYHWGGGTPTHLSPEQMERVFRHYQKRFKFADDAEISIEVDPRVTTDAHLVMLQELGFNRISMGVQDFAPPVQEAIRRIQPLEQTENMLLRSRELGFQGVNYDLIYGLPHQTESSFDHTLDDVIRHSPDRIALYNFAYVPWISPHQKAIDKEALPSGTLKFRIFQNAIQRLIEAGYCYIGMDHFAKPSDELTVAQNNKVLHRNFMGYTTRGNCELYGLGVSAISGLDRFYAQNEKTLPAYYKALDAGGLATVRGIALTDADYLRRRIVNSILCNGLLSYRAIQEEFGVDVPSDFTDALTMLKPMVDDGLIEFNSDGFQLTLLGRVFSRNVAMPFDAYFKRPSAEETASQTIPLYSKTL